LGDLRKTFFYFFDFIQGQMTDQQTPCLWAQIQIVLSALHSNQVFGNSACKGSFASTTGND
jgi:hypothetical protein